MDDNTRIANLKGFLLKQRYLIPYKFVVTIVDDVPVILFDSISDKAKTQLSQTLFNADMTYIQVAVKTSKK